MQPRISIIVPCYNGEKYLRETLDCLKKQTIGDWECIIVNDGSTDGSVEIMKEYAQKDPRYKYIDKENEGPSIARNTAIAASSGKYILPLDADDLIAPSYAEKAIEYLETHDKCKVVYCLAEYFGDKIGEWNLPEFDYNNFIWNNCIFCTAVFRRTDFDKTQGYDKLMIHGEEDWDFFLSLIQPTDEVYRIPEVLFLYRIHGISRTNESHKNLSAMHKILIKNHWDIYEPYIGEFLYIKMQNRSLEEETEYYKNELQNLLNSKSYKLYSRIVGILRKLFHH